MRRWVVVVAERERQQTVRVGAPRPCCSPLKQGAASLDPQSAMPSQQAVSSSYICYDGSAGTRLMRKLVDHRHRQQKECGSVECLANPVDATHCAAEQQEGSSQGSDQVNLTGTWTVATFKSADLRVNRAQLFVAAPSIFVELPSAAFFAHPPRCTRHLTPKMASSTAFARKSAASVAPRASRTSFVRVKASVETQTVQVRARGSTASHGRIGETRLPGGAVSTRMSCICAIEFLGGRRGRCRC
jgi:hypothetical protein